MKVIVFDIRMEPPKDMNQALQTLLDEARKLGVGLVFPLYGSRDEAIKNLVKRVRDLKNPFVAIVTIRGTGIMFGVYGESKKNTLGELTKMLISVSPHIVVKISKIALA